MSMVMILGVISALIVVVLSSYLFFFQSSASLESDEPEETEQTKQAEPEKEVEEAPAGPITVFFGSQTGTAEGFAEQLKQEGEKHGFKVTVADLEDFEPSEFNDSLRVVIMVMATYGEGDPTDNAAEFLKWAKEVDKEDEPLKGLNFTVFGLGNRQYEQYNKIGKDVDKALGKLGGTRCFELGEGDDAGTLEEDFETWKDAMWTSLISQFHPNASAEVSKPEDTSLELPKLPYSISMVSADKVLDYRSSEEAPHNAHNSTKHFFTATRVKVVENRELRTTLDGGSTRHMEVDIHNSDVTYNTADNLAVLPENDDVTVTQLAEAMGWHVADGFELKPSSSDFKLPFPTPCSVREALSSFCDLHGMPRRTSLKDWAPFASDSSEVERLLRMSGKTPEGKALFKSLIEDRKRSLFEIITVDFKSIKVPLDHFLHLAPRLQPRYYTISSSSNAHPKRIHLTVSVIEEERPDNAMFRGVCSGFLQKLELPTTSAASSGKRKQSLDMNTSSKMRRVDEGKDGKRAPWPSCRIFVRPSSFRLPPNPETPIILVGPGTGIAPMRALLQERAYQKANGVSIGPVVLYFGCKNEACDYLYSDEVAQFQKDGVLSTLHLAISRPGYKGTPGTGQPKVYVQHLMKRDENATELWNLIDGQGGYVYVCGGTLMGTDVGHAVVAVIEKYGKKSTQEAEKYLSNLKSQCRYVQELWA
jgi:NADPH-ferrihemoprotein reductase